MSELRVAASAITVQMSHTMALVKIVQIPFRPQSQTWRTIATFQCTRLANKQTKYVALCHWQYTSYRNFANYATSAICSNKCSFGQSRKGKLCSTSSVQLSNPKRGVATEPSSGYEYVLASCPVQLAQSIFEQCHDLTGLPWWGTIVVTTIGLRLVMTLPLAVYSKHIAAKVERLQPEIQTLAKQAFERKYRHRALAEKWSRERISKTRFYLSKLSAKELYIRDNCHPGKSFTMVLTQLPLWVCMSLSLRNMSGFHFGNKIFTDPNLLISDFTTGGMLWFHNLAMSDPYYIFPVAFGVLNLFNIEMQLLQTAQMMRGQRYLLRFMQLVSVGMVGIATFVPASMSLYWATSATYSTCQNILLKLPASRALLGMPTTKFDSDTPLRDLQEAFKAKYLQRRNKEDENSASLLGEDDVGLVRGQENQVRGQEKVKQ